MKRTSILVLVTCLSAFIQINTSHAASESIIVQSTTSTANSGLYGYLLPEFKSETDIDVHVVAVGTGQAIKNAQNCDADVLLVHAKAAEQRFIDDGYGMKRFDVMYNDFVFVGPGTDPANIQQSTSAEQSLQKIAKSSAVFLSRGDNSGTHKKERSLWKAAGIDPAPHSGDWYRETGSGMGATLNVAVGMNAYTLTDRATWISFGNKQNLEILNEGDKKLFNQYGIIMVNPDRCASVKVKPAQAFIDWVLSSKGQALIGSYQLEGKQLFFPNAR